MAALVPILAGLAPATAPACGTCRPDVLAAVAASFWPQLIGLLLAPTAVVLAVLFGTRRRRD